MIRSIYCLVATANIACAAPVAAPDSPSASIATPAEWAFLGQPSVESIISTSNVLFRSRVRGDVDSVLTVAVAGAEASGWIEDHRTRFHDEQSVFLNRTDGSLLSLSVKPDDEAVKLTAVISPPE